jgi:hypothetical protein
MMSIVKTSSWCGLHSKMLPGFLVGVGWRLQTSFLEVASRIQSGNQGWTPPWIKESMPGYCIPQRSEKDPQLREIMKSKLAKV